MSKKINVLAVDDEEFNLDIMQEYFEEAKINAYIAHDGKEALDILQEGKPVDVVVLDLMMPVMDGIEFLAKIKQIQRYKNIPIIMQTAAINMSEAVKNDVFHYLVKPYSKEELLSLINEANNKYHTDDKK